MLGSLEEQRVRLSLRLHPWALNDLTHRTARVVAFVVGHTACLHPRGVLRREHLPTVPDEDELTVGERVEHAAFGMGEIVAIEPGGVVHVEFDDGVRKLMWEYAPARRV
jgi:hypothetical protein